MEKSNRFTELFHSLQDPQLVAQFQRICGVRGTFSRTVADGGSSSSKEAGWTQPHNGACYLQLSGESTTKTLVTKGSGDGDNVQNAAAGTRSRTAFSTKHEHGGETAPRNGAVTAGVGKGDFTGTEPSGTEDVKAPDPSHCSTVKPLRKNSLTGDAGQEFLIDNRFVYYLFTFGTELGNEFFYITFFPFLIWNVDAFVGRRLIMVWVWVMYLGQCTKDVIGWSRPASPPVVKVEMFYNSEYSMPSTHAMSGTAIPIALFFMTYGRWEVKYIHREPHDTNQTSVQERL